HIAGISILPTSYRLQLHITGRLTSSRDIVNPSPQDPPFTGKIKDFLLVLWCQQSTRALIINGIRGRLEQNIQIILPYITSRNSHYHSSLNIPRGYWRTFSFVALPQYPHQSQLPA